MNLIELFQTAFDIAFIIAVLALWREIQARTLIPIKHHVGREYHICEYCHRNLPEVIMIDSHYVCTNHICRNHLGAAPLPTH